MPTIIDAFIDQLMEESPLGRDARLTPELLPSYRAMIQDDLSTHLVRCMVRDLPQEQTMKLEAMPKPLSLDALVQLLQESFPEYETWLQARLLEFRDQHLSL